MSEPDFDIVKSREGKKMLKMVTQDFYNHSYFGLWLFEVIGREWDEALSWVNELKYEAFPQSCTWSIGEWEKAYRITPNESLPLDIRRREVIAKKVQRSPINPEIIRRIIETFTGANTEIDDMFQPYCFRVIIDLSDKVLDFRQSKELLNTIDRIKPAHLDYTVGIFENAESSIHVGGKVVEKYSKTVIMPYDEI